MGLAERPQGVATSILTSRGGPGTAPQQPGSCEDSASGGYRRQLQKSKPESLRRVQTGSCLCLAFPWLPHHQDPGAGSIGLSLAACKSPVPSSPPRAAHEVLPTRFCPHTSAKTNSCSPDTALQASLFTECPAESM